MFRLPCLVALCAAALIAAAGAAPAAELEKVTIVVFGAPSLGAFLPPVIKRLKLDEESGLALDFIERTPDAYTAQFNSGEFQVGGSASLLTVGQADLRGVKVAYLFNLFDFWGAVVTSRAEVKSLRDLEGKELAAARGTTNFLMFDWFARQQGLDPAKLSVVNTATPGLVGYALADRAAAVQLWEPAYTILLAKKPSLRTLDLQIAGRWGAFAGSRNIPYLGVAAHLDWINKHRATIPKLFAAYQAAAEWIVAHPEHAATIIAPKGSAEDQRAIADLIKSNERLGLNLRWASDVRREIEAVYAVGKSIGFLSSDPSRSSIYQVTR
ncbi:MAG TPA: ABC transporter substrate-binding protein [Xanthobacteraceae bacterium]|nr:ABC transporter substrate-binding protein [Xanthobacteraceae bacterium]